MDNNTQPSDADLLQFEALRKELGISDLQLRIALAALEIDPIRFTSDMRRQGYAKSVIPRIHAFMQARAGRKDGLATG